MKIVINACYGGFSLSPRATKRLAELNGRECYFFRTDYENGKMRRTSVSLEELEKKPSLFFSAYDIPNPDQTLPDSSTDTWITLSMEERVRVNEEWDKHSLESRPLDRTDPKLIQVVEELGEIAASGAHAKLRIVEIPDGIEFTIDEYDGHESVHEVHRSWS